MVWAVGENGVVGAAGIRRAQPHGHQASQKGGAAGGVYCGVGVQNQGVGQLLGGGQLGLVGVGGGGGVIAVAEGGVVVGAFHGVGQLGRQARGNHGQQVSAAPVLAQHGHQLHGSGRQILGQGLGGDTGEKGQAGRLGRGDNGFRRRAEGVQPGDVTKLAAAELGAAFQVQLGRLAGGELLLGGGPHLVYQRGVEVAEGAVDHLGLDIAQHPTPTQEVETEAVQAVFLALGHGLGNEVEGGAQGADLRAGVGDEVGSRGGGRHGRR